MFILSASGVLAAVLAVLEWIESNREGQCGLTGVEFVISVKVVDTHFLKCFLSSIAVKTMTKMHYSAARVEVREAS
jgi:hypothetical protein